MKKAILTGLAALIIGASSLVGCGKKKEKVDVSHHCKDYQNATSFTAIKITKKGSYVKTIESEMILPSDNRDKSRTFLSLSHLPVCILTLKDYKKPKMVEFINQELEDCYQLKVKYEEIQIFQRTCD